MYRRYEQNQQNKRHAESPRSNASRHSGASDSGSRRAERGNYQRRDNRNGEREQNVEQQRQPEHRRDSGNNHHRNERYDSSHDRHEHHEPNRRNDTHHHEREHNNHHHRNESSKDGKNPLLGFIPTSIYDPETRKILGFLSAEDLLLVAMILMFLDSEEEGDNLMVYALLYVLASEWIDLDFMKFLK